jgi:hypothetical protein
MKSQSPIERKLTRARTQLLLNQPFFGTLCLRLKLVPGELPTMATDGRRIVYDPAFVDELTPTELEAVLAHEVLHCALGHHCRRGVRDPRLWNEAADLAVNPILMGNGFTLPAGALLDPAFDDLSAEEIYARLSERSREESNPAPDQDQHPAMAPRTDIGQGRQQQPSPEPGNSAQTPSTSMPGTSETRSGASHRDVEDLAKSGTQPTIRVVAHLRRRTVASSRNGTLPLSRPCAQPTRADASRPISPGLSVKTGNQSKTGAQRCVSSWRPHRLVTIAGRRRIGVMWLPACTCPQSSEQVWEQSSLRSIHPVRSERKNWRSLQVKLTPSPMKPNRRPFTSSIAMLLFSQSSNSGPQSQLSSNPGAEVAQTSVPYSSGSKSTRSRLPA